MPKTKTPRPEWVKAMRDINRWMQYMVSRWQPPRTVSYDKETRAKVVRARKDIPAEEYPENNPEKLAELIQYMRAVRGQAFVIERAAQERLLSITTVDQIGPAVQPSPGSES